MTKIEAIKAVRDGDLGLKESKDLVEAVMRMADPEATREQISALLNNIARAENEISALNMAAIPGVSIAEAAIVFDQVGKTLKALNKLQRLLTQMQPSVYAATYY